MYTVLSRSNSETSENNPSSDYDIIFHIDPHQTTGKRYVVASPKFAFSGPQKPDRRLNRAQSSISVKTEDGGVTKIESSGVDQKVHGQVYLSFCTYENSSVNLSNVIRESVF